MLLLEYWQVCPRYPKYEVSYSQKVRHVLLKKEKSFYWKEGYKFINIEGNSIKHKHGIHQMVGWTFVPNSDNKPELHHIDTVKTNNHPLNLMWVTKEEHRELSRLNGQYAHKLKPADIIFIRQYFWLHGKDKLAGMFDVATTTILNIATGKARTDVDYPVHCDYIGTEKIIIDINNGIFYDNAKELSEIIKWPVKEIRRALSGERPNRTPYRYCNWDGIEETGVAPPKKGKRLKPVAKFNSSGELIEKYSDMRYVGDRIFRQRVGAFLNGLSASVDGFYWKLVSKDGSFIEPPKFVSTKKERIPTPENKTPSKPIIKMDKDGNIVQTFPSIGTAALDAGTPKDNFKNFLRKTQTGYHKGFVYKIA